MTVSPTARWDLIVTFEQYHGGNLTYSAHLKRLRPAELPGRQHHHLRFARR